MDMAHQWHFLLPLVQSESAACYRVRQCRPWRPAVSPKLAATCRPGALALNWPPQTGRAQQGQCEHFGGDNCSSHLQHTCRLFTQDNMPLLTAGSAGFDDGRVRGDIRASLAYFVLAGASSLPFAALFSLDATSMFKDCSTMFILITMACNISPIVVFALKSFNGPFRSFRYEGLSNAARQCRASLVLAALSALGLVVFFLFFSVGCRPLPSLFLGLLFVLASAKSAYRVLVMPLLAHPARSSLCAFIVGEGKCSYHRLCPLSSVKCPLRRPVERRNCLFELSHSVR